MCIPPPKKKKKDLDLLPFAAQLRPAQPDKINVHWAFIQIAAWCIAV